MSSSRTQPIQILLTLPQPMAQEFETLEAKSPPAWFASSDPKGLPLGSGGGTANLLAEAWRANGAGVSFAHWLQEGRKLIIHGGGLSRRLPAYAPTGKPLMPIPVFRWSRGQRLDQTLLDLQLPAYQRVLAHGAPGTVAMVASGDVLLHFGRNLPPFPQVDVLGLGMWVKPETAKDFGVFVSRRQRPNELAFFLQKPSLALLRELATDYLCLVDTGMWLFSERAVNVLMERCGWKDSRFPNGQAQSYELYAQFGLALGTAPRAKDPQVNTLTCAVLALPEAEFHHFGTGRQLIESISALQSRELDETKLGLVGAKRSPSQFVLNGHFEATMELEKNHSLWVENSTVPKSWQLAHDHLITGVPSNAWELRLTPGLCLDFVPVGDQEFCLRCYGLDDSFRGAFHEARWLGAPAGNWFKARNLFLIQAGVKEDADIYDAPLFPVARSEDLDSSFLQWLFDAAPAKSSDHAQRWCSFRRLSARQIAEQVNLRRLYQQRAEHRRQCLLPMLQNFRWSVFFKLDLEATARLYADCGAALPELDLLAKDDPEPLNRVHDQMFRSAVLRLRREEGWQTYEANAFARLRDMILQDAQLSPVLPRCNVLEDQIVWGRSPVRLDLAGGWTDTPPYCVEFGGKVVNVAVDLNGQPPIQVFAKLCPRPEIVVRSIDLGAEQHIRTYTELDTYVAPGSEFALAKAAFALAGFLPRFHAAGGFGSLEEQLRDFGGGIELSLLSAVPKGSGLGTSSILAATVLATLGDLCGLHWDKRMLFLRTLALEQMLTTGGGWQDQAGAIYRGIKLIETHPGLAQTAAVRWLPDHLLGHAFANRSILLYYTGITRLAKNILQEIVRGIFLNSAAHLATIAEIGANADRACQAIERCDYAQLTEVIRASWDLNQQLDAGTNPPEVQRLLAPVQDWLAAAKLLGAGGGGYLLMLAHDETAASKIRQTLGAHPPNPRARFVDFTLSDTGLLLTRS